jgi:hypothetical protein
MRRSTLLSLPLQLVFLDVLLLQLFLASGTYLFTLLNGWVNNISFLCHRGARYLTGDNLEVVWVEFSTLS